MTTNHPGPTPPTSPAAVSAPLRPVEEIVQRVIDARRGMNAALIASAHRLNAPYADQPDLSPWDTTIAPRRLALSVAIEDLIESHSSLLARLRAAEETLAEMAPLLIARSDSASLIEGLEKVRQRLCHYGTDASTCDCKYGASFKGEQSGCPELRRAIDALAEGASR